MDEPTTIEVPALPNIDVPVQLVIEELTRHHAEEVARLGELIAMERARCRMVTRERDTFATLLTTSLSAVPAVESPGP